MKSIATQTILSALSFVLIAAQADVDETFGVKFRKIECWADNELVSLHHCYLSKLSPDVSSLNIAGKSLAPIPQPIDIHVILSIGMGPMFFTAIDYRLEWCALMSGEDRQMVVMLILAVIRDSLPGLLHECPYSGEYEVKNLTLDDTVNLAVSQFVPSGNYKVEINVVKELKKVVSMALIVEVKSVLKNFVLGGK